MRGELSVHLRHAARRGDPCPFTRACAGAGGRKSRDAVAAGAEDLQPRAAEEVAAALRRTRDAGGRDFFREPASRELIRQAVFEGRRYGRADDTLRERLGGPRSEEHTSELQSPCNLVCRLLLEKKKT